MTKVEKITVALADDHTMFRRGLISILKPYKNIEVVYDAANGQEMLDHIAMTETRPRVCIIDINMPVLNGYDTAKYIRRHYRDIKMLALSMYDDEANIIQMLRAGVSGYLLKDSEPDTLVEAIKKVHEDGFYHSDLITNDILNSVHDKEQLKLSSLEIEFLKMACTEMTYKEMATAFNVSERTVDGYRDRLFDKLKVKSRIGLVIYAIRNNLVDLF
ncbi:MAG TPA: response regulator transcription factor [Flavipsychrobacter sp.]|nr:response regulator transcription factor [Flavipsychrobacter sp.]